MDSMMSFGLGILKTQNNDKIPTFMKYALYIFCLITLFISCEKAPMVDEIDHSGSAKKETFSYVYKNSYAVTEIHFYRGGENPAREIITEKQAQEYIIPSFDVFNLDEVKIDFDKMKLYEVKGTANEEKSISITSDSLYCVENGKKSFNGVVESNKSQYSYFKTFYYYRFQDEKKKVESSGSVNGVLSQNDVFKKENLLFGDKEYGFSSPADMKNKNDVVCWVTIRYVLKSK